MNVLRILPLLLSVPVFAAGAEDSGEEKLRQRFVTAYTSAQTVDRRTEAVAMLKGVKEEKSQRLLVGMLGDMNEVVRKAACETIAGTPDKEGYFVKPLMGALSDKSLVVRAAAADALSRAAIKADAVRALALSLHALVAEKDARDADQKEAFDALMATYDTALTRLSGKKSVKDDPRELGSFWLEYWKQNEETLRAEDEKKMVVAPKSREGMAPDSFDQKKP